jgi:hypothetical protein
MAGYAGPIPDEENLNSGNRIQPFATTPMQVPNFIFLSLFSFFSHFQLVMS